MALVTAIRDLDTLDSHRLHWQALLSETSDCSIYQTFDWYRWSVTNGFPEARITVLKIESGDKLLGFLPLHVVTRNTRFGTIQSLTNRCGVANAYFRPIGRSATAMLMTAAHYLKRHSLWWDEIELVGIERDSWDHGRTEDSFRNAGIRLVERDENEVVKIDLRTEATDTKRGQLNLDQAKRPAFSNRFELEHYRPWSAHDEDIDEQEALMEQVLNVIPANAIQTTFCSDRREISEQEKQTRLLDLHQMACDRGVFDLVVVKRDQQPVGFVYHMTFDGKTSRVAWGVADFDRGANAREWNETKPEEVRSDLLKQMSDASIGFCKKLGDEHYESAIPMYANEFGAARRLKRISYHADSAVTPWTKILRLWTRRHRKSASQAS